eukprot:symbB.v1.2.021556.t1/scaffold1847.1/size122519/9
MESISSLVAQLQGCSDKDQASAAGALRNLARNADNKVAIAKAGGIEVLVQIARNGSDQAKESAAGALLSLAMNKDNQVAIAKAGGIEPLVQLARNGSDEAKETAVLALKNLAVNADNTVAIAKAGGIEALDGTQQMDRRGGHSGCHEDLQAAEGRTVVSLPSGKGAGVAMFSARFDGGPMERKFRAVHKILVDNKYDVMMVAADAGENFGDLTTEYLGRLQREKGKMLAVCTKNYGEQTASSYSSFKELKFALDYERDIQVVPLKVEETYPPEPPGGPNHKYDKKNLAASYVLSVFKPSVVYLNCVDKSAEEIATLIAAKLRKREAPPTLPGICFTEHLLKDLQKDLRRRAMSSGFFRRNKYCAAQVKHVNAERKISTDMEKNKRFLDHYTQKVDDMSKALIS